MKTVGRTIARVSVQEHMANYQAARALLGKGKGKSGAKKAARKSAVKKGEAKEVTFAIGRSAYQPRAIDN